MIIPHGNLQLTQPVSVMNREIDGIIAPLFRARMRTIRTRHRQALYALGSTTGATKIMNDLEIAVKLRLI